MKPLNLQYVHTGVEGQIGYGRYGTRLAGELEKMGVTIYDDLTKPGTDPNRKRNWADGDRTGLAQVACWVSTPSHARGWFKGQTPILSSMWEATVLPPSFSEMLHEFETVIVPSRQNQELFSKFHQDVRFLPLGVDPDVWKYTARTPPSLFFDFLIGGSGPRKGTMLAYDAFVKVFGGDEWEHGTGPIPRLIMKSPRAEEPVTHPRVKVIGGRITAEEEVALYASAHCYLQPSRGEGFGLQPLQAIAQGLPTVLTAAHGHDSFAHLGYGLSSTLTKAAYFLHGDAGEWWEPDFDELCGYMEYVYNQYDEACTFARGSAAVVRTDFTWEQCAEGFLDIIGRDRLVPFTGTEWYEPTMKLFEIVTRRDYLGDVGGTMRFFKKGESFWDTADMKRILFDSGVLDPVCLTGNETGLLPDQLGAVDDYSAACAYCPTCSQRMNSQPTKSDDLYDEPVLKAV